MIQFLTRFYKFRLTGSADHTHVDRKRRYILPALLGFTFAACTGVKQTESPPASSKATASGTLTIWWEKGFNLEEDEALQKLVDQWKQQSGHSVKLSFYTTDELPQKTQRALEAGKPPDILMSHNAERSLYPRLGWQGKLMDVSDIIEPVKSMYPGATLEAVKFYNNLKQQRSYYAVPFSQSSNFIFYWRDLVEKAGYHDRDIPQDWNGFWNFWKQVQDKLKLQPQTQKIYGLGFSLSDKAGDTYFLFEQGLEAYDAQLLTPSGELRADDPTVRQRIIECLKWYTQFYKAGYMLPDAVKWLNPDNNTSLLNREVVMTPNTSMTIPATVRKDPEVYRHQLVTRAFPNKLNGQPVRHILTIKQAVIFTDSPNQTTAKAFLSYFIQPQVLGGYLKASGIRNQPVTQPTWQDPFWSNPDDPHISVAVKVLASGQTRPFPSVYHPAYSLVTQENVWGKAIHQIAVNGISPEQAADEALTRIKQIFQQWQ